MFILSIALYVTAVASVRRQPANIVLLAPALSSVTLSLLMMHAYGGYSGLSPFDLVPFTRVNLATYTITLTTRLAIGYVTRLGGDTVRDAVEIVENNVENNVEKSE